MAAGIFAALFVAWIEIGFGGPHVTHVFNDVAGTVAPLLAAGAAFLVARRHRGHARRAWALIGSGVLAWGLGEAAWTYYELVARRDVPFPSIADIGYLLFIPLTIVGMLSLPTAPRRLESRVRTLLDGLIVVTSLFFVSWDVVLGPMWHTQSGGAFENTIALAYPIGDIALASIAILVASRVHHGGRAIAGLLSAGLLVLAVADTGFAYLTMHDAYSTGNPIDAAWVIAFLLIGLGAVRRLSSEPVADDDERSGWLKTLLPYAGLPLVVAVAFGEGRSKGIEPFLMLVGLILITMTLARQFLTVRENIYLARRFEIRVAERTAELVEQREESRLILQTANDAYISPDESGVILEWNRQAERLFGQSGEEVIGATVDAVTRSATLADALRRAAGRLSERSIDAPQELTVHARNGDGFPVELTTWVLETGSGRRVNAFVRDISERKAFESALSHRALHDSLTNLANRALFGDRLDHALARSRREGKNVAVLLLDLDNFKTVNDSMGHAAGDALIVQVGERLGKAVRPEDTVARLGGDEFAILLDGTTDAATAINTCERIQETLRQPFAVDGRELAIESSAGIALGEPGTTAEQLLGNADVAMYSAKNLRRGGYEVFQKRMRDVVVERMELEADLRKAIERDELALVYQPIVELTGGRMTGVEALVRWNHPTRGFLGPGQFIGLAEETGLIVDVGRWVLRRACRDAGEWASMGKPVSLSVNLSVKQLHDPTLIDAVRHGLQGSGLNPSGLVLEITESVMMADGEYIIDVLNELKSLGVRLAIDDFGTGYSSLSYLRRLPVDVLKIDKAFVDNITRGVEDSAVARAIIKLAETLSLKTTAEGIETPAQAARLTSLGCDLGQGFHFSRPLPANQIQRRLAGSLHMPLLRPRLEKAASL